MSYRDKQAEHAWTWLMGVVVQFGIAFFTAWMVMLALGVAHHQWPVIPAFGYWATWLLILGTSCAAGAIHGGMRVKIKE